MLTFQMIINEARKQKKTLYKTSLILSIKTTVITITIM